MLLGLFAAEVLANARNSQASPARTRGIVRAW